MEIDKIYFDLDGVLADFEKGLLILCELPHAPQNEEEDDEMWSRVSKTEHFYDKLDPMEDAITMFQVIYKKYGNKCEVLTGIPKPRRNVATAGEDKINWVHRLFDPDIVVHIVFTEQKKEYCKGPSYVLIDDYKKNIKAWESNNGSGILFQNANQVLEDLKKIEEQ